MKLIDLKKFKETYLDQRADEAPPAFAAGSPDYVLLFIIIALVAAGLIMVFSASPSLGMQTGDSLYYLKKHIMSLLIGFAAMVLGLRMNYAYLKKWAPLCLLGITLLLSAVFIPGFGRSAGGAVRWLYISVLSFQPSEIAKMIVVIFLASVLSSYDRERESALKILSLALFPVALIAVLVLNQPDLGTTIVIIATTFIMLFVGGINPRYLWGMAIAGAAGVAALSVTSAYRFKRLLAFLDPWEQPRGMGFHIIQSLLAIGSGGLFGTGLGGSRQKFFYLPQHYTDFIFSILSEELGFFGAAGVVILFVLFVIRGIRIARFADNAFGSYLAAGIVSWIGLQAMINLCVVTGMLPTTGIPLPFISFGGTSLVITLYSMGVLLNISKSAAMPGEVKR